MKIQKIDLKWNGDLKPLDLQKVEGIALHHMAHPTAGIQDVHRWHLNNGWAGIGYNYWIDFEGNIYEGRGLNQGAATLDYNDVLISIGFQGDYDKTNHSMPPKQFKAGVWLIGHLKDRIPTIKRVDGHRYWNNTSCPGTYFPLKEMREGKMMSEVKIETIEQALDYLIVSGLDIDKQHWLNAQRYVKHIDTLFIKIANHFIGGRFFI